MQKQTQTIIKRRLQYFGAACALSLAILGTFSSTAAAESVVKFKLDYSQNTIVPPWKFIQAASPDRITVVDDPAGSATKVGRFELQASDVWNNSSRTEVMYKADTGNTEFNGDNDYYAFSTYFPTDFKSASQWGLFFQVHGADGVGSSPPLALETRPHPNTQLRLAVRGGDVDTGITTKYIDPVGMNITAGSWQDFIVRWDKSTGSDGLVELWYRASGGEFNLVASYTGPNFYKRGIDSPPGYIKQGYYRNPGGTSDTTYPHVLYHKGIWKTSDYASALTYFGVASPPPPPPAPDTEAPSVPVGLLASSIGQTTTTISWQPSTDTGTSGLAGYKLYRNGVQIGTPTEPTYADSNLTPDSLYVYRVEAFDGAGNVSASSETLVVTTAPAPPVIHAKLDYSAGTLVPPWTSLLAANSSRATVVADPSGSSKKVARFELRYGDKVSNLSKIEVQYKNSTAGTEKHGDDDYYPFSIYFPVGFKPASSWGIPLSMISAEGGSPNVALETRSNSLLRLVVRGGNTSSIATKTIDPAGLAITPGAWQDFVLRWKKSYTAAGVTELWYRNQTTATFGKVATFTGPNFYIKNNLTKPAYIRQGYSRNSGSSSNYPNILYHRGIWKAGDYNSALSYFN